MRGSVGYPTVSDPAALKDLVRLDMEAADRDLDLYLGCQKTAQTWAWPMLLLPAREYRRTIIATGIGWLYRAAVLCVFGVTVIFLASRAVPSLGARTDSMKLLGIAGLGALIAVALGILWAAFVFNTSVKYGTGADSSSTIRAPARFQSKRRRRIVSARASGAPRARRADLPTRCLDTAPRG